MSSSLPDLLRTLSARGATLTCVQGALTLRPKGVSAGLEETIQLWKEDLLRLAGEAGGGLGPRELEQLAHTTLPPLPNPWAYLLERVEPLAARLVELQAPVLRLDVERIARGYQSIEGMDFEGVAKLLRWMIEAVAQQYPRADDIHVIAQWPGKWPEKTRNEVLAGWESVTL